MNRLKPTLLAMACSTALIGQVYAGVPADSTIRIEYKAQTAAADMANKSPFGLTAIVPPEKLSK